MTKEKLQELTLEALREVARSEEVLFDPGVSRETLIELILEEEEEEKTDRQSTNNAAMRVSEKKFENIKDEAETGSSDFELPESYNETKIKLLLRDPLWAFSYWDLKESDIEKIENLPDCTLFLRVYQVSGGKEAGRRWTEPFEIPVKLTDRSWYINLPKTGLKYELQLIVRTGDDEKVLCKSNAVESPTISINPTADSISDEQFRTILSVSGLEDPDDFSEKGGIPQRIISLLDTHYLHLQG